MKLHSKPAMVRSPTTRLATTKSSSFKEKKNISVHVESPIQVTTVTEEPRNEQLIEEPAHLSSKTVPEPPQPRRPLPKHRVNTLAKVKGVDYLQGGRQPIPPMTLHGRILTNVDPRSRERAQKRWDALRDVVSRTPELTRITQKLQESIRILKMDPCDRRDTDIAHLYSWLMSQENLSPLFQTMPEKMGKNICRELEFLHLRSNDVVVHQGDVGSTCFILISGLVAVFVRSPDEQERFTRLGLRKCYPPDPSTSLQHLADPSASKPTPPPSIDPIVQRTGSQNFRAAAMSFGSKVASLKPGATFGEICLIEPDSRRTATVLVDGACSSANFIVLTSSSYTKMTATQKTEGTISDHIAFLHQLFIFRTWSKMQLMRLASSMRYMVFSPQQFLQRKNADIEYFYMILSGEVREVSSIVFQQVNHVGGGTKKLTEHKVTAELTYIGKYDVVCEGLVYPRKLHLSPVDIRAETTVCALALSKKLFQLSILSAAQLHQKHVAHTLRVLEQVSDARQKWREARINQATAYPDLLIKITSKMMRLSGNLCMQCGRCTHIAGDSVCLFDAFLKAHEPKPVERQYFHHLCKDKTDEPEDSGRSPSPHNHHDHVMMVAAAPALAADDTRLSAHRQLLAEQWTEAAKHGISPRRPATTVSTRR
ncbi:hypothetical protein, variant 1 [Aphanomyces astaci]|uniref:Cyclic nucleotide-binding domain-containing protein n=2 Tax=Aphanomyces astaci TaxID=112090 RepID=W4GMJ3_APHAT|nr:hypothetical protein, variant 1 [Aphanomyces astaci]ETV80103.1 hypothetical protein, variant 1 [Aphanomyces astaci]|eukprot:XP_009830027.1 hypothetical protein, variant 1 [Aphanomyces astaci]